MVFSLLAAQTPSLQAFGFWDPWGRRPNSVFDDSFWSDFEKTMDNPLMAMGSSTKVSEDKITLTFDIPGLSSQDVVVVVEQDNVLVIRGQKNKKCDKKDQEGESHYNSSRSFYKVLTLPKNAEIKKISAEVKEGVLTIIIPRQPSSSETVHTVAVK